MTVLATTIGCAFLIVLASVGFGVQDTMQNEILNNENVTEIQLWGDETLSAEDERFIQKIEHVNVILKQADVEQGVNVTFEDRTGYSQGQLRDMDAQAKLPNTLSEGRLPEAANEIVVGYHFGQSLLNDADRKALEEKSIEAERNGTWYDGADEGYKKSMLGQQVQLQFGDPEDEKTSAPQAFTIVGVLKQPSYEWYHDTNIIFNDQLPTLVSGIEFYPKSTIYVDSMENVMPVLDTLKEEGYQVYSVLEQLDQMEMFFLVFKIGLVFIGTIAVFIASIGIFNTMTMAVTERTREIGVLKAIGASPALIQRLFLMESAFIGVLGTVLAIIVSYGISMAANILLPYILSFALDDENLGNTEFIFSSIPLSLVLVAGGISLFVAIISGWRPARKATKIEVIQALRQEL